MRDWKRVDFCGDVIYESSPVIKEVSVYSSGNNAVLTGWASEDGLGNREKFPWLEKINLFVQDGLEDDKRWQSNNRHFQKKITEHGLKGRDENSGKEIEFKIIVDNDQGRSTTENIEPTRQFAAFLMNASMEQGKDKQVAPVKIAIIDDGIDATLHDLQSKITGGATFCHYPHSSELVNSYFVPRGKHGTLMAQLICDLCPGTELYIARLEELPLPSGSGRRVTARSAAKAVEWAVNCGVDIISMSGTIQTAAHDSEDMSSLETALNNAKAAKIHLFCSASDQGANTKEEYFPGDWKQCIRIGGATFTGEKLTWVDDKVDFWFPGRNVPFLSRDGKSVTAMAAAFRIMAKGMDGKFPRTDEVLNKLFKNKIQQATQKAPKSLGMETLEWSDSSKKALADLLLHIQV
ncbi:Intracellular serine protease [Metarhizium anisopliae]|nr:Intracellular serine protease [Metarhizium anisopliae]